jgi:hypothetical protein
VVTANMDERRDQEEVLQSSEHRWNLEMFSKLPNKQVQYQ